MTTTLNEFDSCAVNCFTVVIIKGSKRRVPLVPLHSAPAMSGRGRVVSRGLGETCQDGGDEAECAMEAHSNPSAQVLCASRKMPLALRDENGARR